MKILDVTLLITLFMAASLAQAQSLPKDEQASCAREIMKAEPLSPEQPPKGTTAPDPGLAGSVVEPPQRFLWGDVDQDGLEDLFVLHPGGNLLFKNLGDGGFEDVTKMAFPDGAGRGISGFYGDYNGDDLADLFLFHSEGFSLYRNDGKFRFADMTESLGLDPMLPQGEVRLADYDQDGDDDLMVQTPQGDRIYRNQRGQEFVEVAITVPDRGRNVSMGNNSGKKDPAPPVMAPGGPAGAGSGQKGSFTWDAIYLNDNSPYSVGVGIPEVEGGDDSIKPNDIVDNTVTGEDLKLPLFLDCNTYLPVLSCSNNYGDAISVSAGGQSAVGVRAVATAEDGDTCGIYAESASANGMAVLARATSEAGEACGVYGMSVSEEGSGVHGRCGNSGGIGNGVFGESFAVNGKGVHGHATHSTGCNFGVYAKTESNSGFGVYSEVTSTTPGFNFGVYAKTNSPYSYGVYGYAASPTGTAYGVYGYASSPDGYGGYFMGGTSTDVLHIRGGSDLSEKFDIRGESEETPPEPGMVVRIDGSNPGGLVVCSKAYDKRVAGIISGAGGIKTGMLMGQEGSEATGDDPVALTGRVYCYADASAGSIEPGDLLTTSSTPGHAMKVSGNAQAHGAIIGKAMTSLDSGRGLVLVLVSLH